MAAFVGGAGGSLSLPATVHFAALFFWRNQTSQPDWISVMMAAGAVGWLLGSIGGSVWTSLRVRYSHDSSGAWADGFAAWQMFVLLHLTVGLPLLVFWFIVLVYLMKAVEKFAVLLGAR
jgi:hypothetical protein